ncbi:MAG: IS110 family transposase [Bacilli bacterium]|nr:IS110 family transposase [Bacilli bacterium]
MSKFYYVGLDISKYKHDGYVLDEVGTIIYEHFTFLNDLDGFEIFRSILKSLNPNKQIIRVGLESTGHYGKNLKMYLREHDYQYMEMNPLLTAKFREALNVAKIKTDKIDSRAIIKTMCAIGYTPTNDSKPEYDQLKYLYRERLNYIDSKAALKVKIVNFFDKVFPELEHIVTLNSAVARYLFNNYPDPKKLIRGDLDSIFSALFRISRQSFNQSKFKKLIQSAKHSIGNFDHASYFIAKKAMENLVKVESDIKDFDNEINKIISEIDSPIKDMKGVGNATIAAIYGEFGAFEHFNTAAEALKYTGIIPNINQSGKSDFKGKISKCGSSYLRCALMRAMMPLRNSQPVFHNVYQLKRQEGKHNKVAETHMVKKFIRVIFHLIKTNTIFNASALR